MLSKSHLFTFFVSGTILIFFLNAIAAEAATKSKTYKYLRIFYYRDSTAAHASLMKHHKSIDVLAPQSYAVNADGQLIGSIDPSIIAFSHSHKIKIMPLVTNAGFGQGAYQNILNDPAKQDAAINVLIAKAKANKYWGWQIDFEQMDASYRDKFSEFVARAYGAFQKNNLIASVAVVAQVSDDPNDYKNGLWQNLIGVYDYATISANSDFVSVMAYDDPESSGPVAEYSWLKRVINWSRKFIPDNQLSLGIPFYYWEWSNDTGKRIDIGGNQGIDEMIKKHYVTFHWSAKEQAPYMTYWSHAKKYTVWYENAKSIAAKMALLKKYKFHSFSAWALGLELASVYKSL